METAASPTPDPTQNRKPNRFAAAFSLVFLFSGLGWLGGYVAFSIVPTYQSEAVFKVSYSGSMKLPNQQLFTTNDVKHDKYIIGPSALSDFVTRNNLADLKSFQSFQSFDDSFQRDKILPILISNLDCEKITPSQPEYRLTCRSSVPEDAETILRDLLDWYDDRTGVQPTNDLIEYQSNLEEIRINTKTDLVALGRLEDAEEKQALLFRLKDVERRIVNLESSGLLSSTFRRPSTQVDVLEEPNKGAPSLPNLIKFLIGGSLIGFGLGCLVVLFRPHFKDNSKSEPIQWLENRSGEFYVQPN